MPAGIAGLSLGNISQAYATGPGERLAGNVGGLVGYSGGSITQSYATGAVSGTSNVGGLLGYNGGSITQSYWDSYTTGQAAGIGAGAASSGLNESSNQRSGAVGGGKRCVQAERLCRLRLHPRQYLYRLVLDRWPDPPIRPVGIFDQYLKRASASVDGDESRCELPAHIQH